jgi:DNA-binding CsgD family transcriptional regulator
VTDKEFGDLTPILPQPASGRHLAHSAPELVALSERFNDWIFLGALGFVSFSTLTSLVFLPLRDSAVNGRPPLSAVIAGVSVLVMSLAAIWRARGLYRVLRRYPRLELVGVVAAALMLSILSPLRNELWWSASAILMVLATLTSLCRVLAYTLVVLLANLVAHLVSGDLPQTSTVGIVGLWIGLPFWSAMAAVVPDRMAAYILRLNTTRPTARLAPRPVKISTDGPRDDPHERGDDAGSDGEVTTAATGDDATRAQNDHTAVGEGPTARLTSRQLQVVVLLAAGHRYRYIAACLSISEGQVHRHVANAIRRLDLRSVNELAAVAVADGVVPAETTTPDAASS